MPIAMHMTMKPMSIDECVKHFNITTNVLLAYARYLEVNEYQHHYGEGTTAMMWYVTACNSYMSTRSSTSTSKEML